MILGFYDKDFKGIANNTALLIDNKNFNLVKRPIELNDFSCICEAFTEDVQPTFIIVRDDTGKNIIYSCLAGVPQITKDNKTKITGTDLKNILSSDVILNYGEYTSNNTIGDVIGYLFNKWNTDANKGIFEFNLTYKDNCQQTTLSTLIPANGMAVYNVLEEVKKYLLNYDLYLDTELDIVNKRIIFTIGKMLKNEVRINTWEYDIKNYGKWIADINETQGYYNNNGNLSTSGAWILTSNNEITKNSNLRDIYPIKRRVFISEESQIDADAQAISELLNYRFAEDLEIDTNNIEPNFETRFDIYIKKNNVKQFYKSLPCGELRYNYNGLYKVQIGFRYTSIDFI